MFYQKSNVPDFKTQFQYFAHLLSSKEMHQCNALGPHAAGWESILHI